jgi:hypothetical protein
VAIDACRGEQGSRDAAAAVALVFKNWRREYIGVGSWGGRF